MMEHGLNGWDTDFFDILANIRFTGNLLNPCLIRLIRVPSSRYPGNHFINPRRSTSSL